MIQTKDINVDLSIPERKLRQVTTETIDASQGSQEEDKENIEKRKKEKKKPIVSTADIDWKKREKQAQMAKARLAAKVKRAKKKT